MKSKKQGQHFLLSPESRTLSLREIFQLSDDEAFEIFKQYRFKNTNGNPVCSHCGSLNNHYFIKSRKIWKCSECKKQFSLTSKTIFAYHKLKLQDYLAVIAIFTNGVKGYSSLQLSRDMNVQYKTAFVLTHKIREALYKQQNNEKFSGTIEIDGSYFGGFIKPKNKKGNRIDRRLEANKNDKEKCVVVLKELSEDRKNDRTRITIASSENTKEIKPFVKANVLENSKIYADENPAYDILIANYNLKRVNHSEEYKNFKNHACINQAESFFSRMERSNIGQHHHWSPEYLLYYANELAYREDMRRKDNRVICMDILNKCLESPTSERLCGYWQRYKK